ncbi:MAG: FAD:protein FMN transferase [Phycisphaeraceae bacterium]|nr:FAD:protein FMN transferase [Phycisphaeraceae bacterium]MCW5762532.1 FAD:protein FMN transferase [Phycisphaeraceae bacterium]
MESVNVRLATHAMGTRFELVLNGQDESFLRAVGEEAIAEIQEQHARLSVFDRGSLLSRVNALGAERWVEIDRDLLELLMLCRRVWEESDGAFDPAVGGLMRRWGFRGEVGPAAGAVAGGFESVEIDEANSSVKLGAGVELDLGGVAKGYALDRVWERMRALGVERGIIHGGTSTVVAIGSPPGVGAWRVQVPSGASEAGLLDVHLRDGALSVSSPSGRERVEDGLMVGHVMDVRCGKPARGARAAAVAGASAAEADAWATALVVLGQRPHRMPVNLSSAIAGDGCWKVEQQDAVFVTNGTQDGR